MIEQARCPKCDAEIPAGAPAGLCPKCLLQAGLDSQQPAAPQFPPTQASPPPSPASAFMPPAPEELASRFPQLEILALLGRGGMGAVYKAKQRGLDRLVALKILPPEVSSDPAFAERFTREARSLAKLTHSNIVTVYDFGVVGQAFQPDPLVPTSQAGKPDVQVGLYFILMEYVDGVNLRQAIQAGDMTPKDALAIVPQICEALQFAHDEGIVHRDIKPENILIDKRGRVKIADFGLAKLLGQGASDHSLTATHQVMGTLRYMAPEQMQGSREVDHRADIYSLGVVFYELLTGELPMGKFAPPSKRVEVDVRLDEIVLRALEQDPEQRYQHASEVKTDLATISSSEATKRLDTPAVASDAVMFRRLTVVNLIMSTVWAALLAMLHAGYLMGADWYFKQELPYDYLMTLWGLASAVLAFSLALWWYLLAKQRDTPRSLANFWSLTQQPDPRAKRIWKPALVYLAIYLATMLVGLLFSDAVRSTARTVAFGIGPFVCMAILRWTYAERFRDGGRESNVSSVVPTVSSEPRFSRFAIAGAVWALFGLLAVIPTLYFIGLNRVWNGTALPTDVIHSEPPLVFSIFMGALLVIGSGAPIGTTIYGGIAIGHIKRSGGKIIGLPLAVADVLFFPLLALGGLIAALVARVGYSMAPHPNAAAVTSAGSFGVLVALVVCFFVARAVWRAIARRVADAAPAIPPSGTLARAWHEWWFERDRWFTRAVQTVLILIHFVCLGTFNSWGFSFRNVEGRSATSVRIGWPSPWFTYETYPEPNLPFRYHINFLSSSLLVATIGLLAYFVYWRIEKTKADSKLGFWSSPKAILIFWAMFAVTGISAGLWNSWTIEDRLKSETPDSTRPKTGEVWSGNPGAEHVIYLGPGSPTVSYRLARHLSLHPSQSEAMNQAFQKFFREFNALEGQNTRHETEVSGHQITTIAPLLPAVPPLEQRFWTELDSALDGRQLTLGRKTVGLQSGMFETGNYGYRIEIWRVGQTIPWFHWTESYPGRANVSQDVGSSGPELPEKLRRFWKEPETDAAKTQGEGQE